MKTELFFDVQIYKERSTIVTRREFAANVGLVWKAWTTPNILDQWVAPKPMVVQTRAMDFREDGSWHFALVSPEGKKFWCRYDYSEIEFQKTITELRAYSDENGAIPPGFQHTECTTTFGETDGKTLVTITARYGSPDVFEKMSSQGHQKGFSSTLVNLDKLLVRFEKQQHS